MGLYARPRTSMRVFCRLCRRCSRHMVQYRGANEACSFNDRGILHGQLEYDSIHAVMNRGADEVYIAFRLHVSQAARLISRGPNDRRWTGLRRKVKQCLGWIFNQFTNASNVNLTSNHIQTLTFSTSLYNTLYSACHPTRPQRNVKSTTTPPRPTATCLRSYKTAAAPRPTLQKRSFTPTTHCIPQTTSAPSADNSTHMAGSPVRAVASASAATSTSSSRPAVYRRS